MQNHKLLRVKRCLDYEMPFQHHQTLPNSSKTNVYDRSPTFEWPKDANLPMSYWASGWDHLFSSRLCYIELDNFVALLQEPAQLLYGLIHALLDSPKSQKPCAWRKQNQHRSGPFARNSWAVSSTTGPGAVDPDPAPAHFNGALVGIPSLPCSDWMDYSMEVSWNLKQINHQSWQLPGL